MRDGEYCRLATDDPGDDTRNFGETRVFHIENTTLANLSPVESEKVRVTADTTKAVFPVAGVVIFDLGRRRASWTWGDGKRSPDSINRRFKFEEKTVTLRRCVEIRESRFYRQ